MKTRAWLLLTIFLIVSSTVEAQTNRNATAYLRRGDALLSKNDVDGALANYNKALELNPRFAEAYVKRGIARRAKGDLNGSIEDYEKAGELDPKFVANNRYVAESYSNRGFIKMNEMKIEEAIADFNRAIGFDASEPNHYFRRGQARLIKEALPEAIVDFGQALSINKNNDFLRLLTYANRGYALLLQGKQDEANKDFDKCNQLQSGKKFVLEFHLRSIQAQINEMRRRRAAEQRNVT